MEAGLGAGAAVVVGLVGLIGVMWNRNRNGSNGLGDKLISLMKGRDDALEEMVKNQAAIVETQRQIVEGQRHIVEKIGELATSHVRMDAILQQWTERLNDAARLLTDAAERHRVAGG